MTREELDLLHGYLNDTLGEADFARLQFLLRENAEARRTLRSLSTVQVKLQHTAASFAVPMQVTGLRETPKPFRWAVWRPLIAAAAGLVIGLFSASLVFGYASRIRERRIILPVADASFEELAEPVKDGFPAVTGVWQGDEGIRVDRADALEGAHVLRLDPVKSGTRQFSYVHQIVPVDEFGRLELSVAFHAGGGARHRVIARVMSYEVPAGQVRSLGPDMPGEANSSAQRAITLERHGWQRVGMNLSLPRGTRCMVITLGARTLDAAPEPCFLDAVEATLFVPEL